MLQILDTTVLIDYLRGRPAVSRVQALLERDITPATTVINVEEIVRGLREAERGAAETLIEGLVVLPITTPDAWLAGRWRRDYASRGRTLWQADCLIAAVCVRAGAPLATSNPKDFPMTEIEVTHWPVGQ
ncbi:MAG: type II toxin-antitoxin system VapC family toxin [Austwickia sp.]|nr:type II toxin-antitoxin system VapC family toxin [Austwickia sp.]